MHLPTPGQMPTVQYDPFIMEGGVDQVTPLLKLKTGVLRDALNHEANILGGYSRIAGYERTDGQKLPSSTDWISIHIGSFVNIPSVGDTVNGLTSLATGYVLAVGANYIILSELVGNFVVGETIKDAALVVGTTITPTPNSITALQVAQYFALAADRQRTHILAVPGSGPVRGVFVYNDIVYAWRDNAGATQTLLYQQTSTGWQQVTFFYELAFTAGTTQPIEGSTLTQGGVTATIKRVATQSGAWAGSAAGRFIISAPVGGNFAAGAATDGATTVTLSGIQTAITFSPGGTFDHELGNFGGQGTTARIYGCDGVNRAFEFDGTVLTPITTGSTPDAPNHVAIHKNYLFLSIMASMLFCAPGLPYDWTAIDGAGVLAVGANVTNMIELPGAQTTAAMGVTTRTTMYVLYGTGASTWNLVPMNVGTGGIAFTAQNMQHTYFMDDRGVIDMQETLNYGNFNVNTITFPVNNFIIQKRSKVVGSALQRTKSQYRVFFNDGSALYITNVHGQYQWMNVTSYNMPVMFPNPVSTIVNAKLSTGDEVTYFGSTNGYVYKLDSGTSFDGAAINAYLTFAADQVGSPRMLKRFRHAQIEINSSSYTQLNFGYTLGFNSNLILQPSLSQQTTSFIESFWDAFTWDNFTWDGVGGTPSFEVDMTGTAENYAFVISSNVNYLNPYTVASAVVHYTQRRGKR